MKGFPWRPVRAMRLHAKSTLTGSRFGVIASTTTSGNCRLLGNHLITSMIGFVMLAFG